MRFNHHPSSFRDPSGYVFVHNGNIYRQINKCYREHYIFNDTAITRSEAYPHQVAFINSMFKKITDSIRTHASRPTVIIFQGDHGIDLDTMVRPKEFFPNFNAIYFSNGDYRLLTDSTHSVNLSGSC